MNYNDMTRLDIIEALASYEYMVESEQDLSDRFDQMVDEFGELFLMGTKDLDECAMREWFNNWTDALCKEGEIHSEQLREYTYCGGYDF